MSDRFMAVRFANGEYVVPELPYMSDRKLNWQVTLANDADHGDWKTALARKLRSAKKGESAILLSVMQNLYGRWAQLRLEDGTRIDVSPTAVIVEATAHQQANRRGSK